MKKKNFPLIAIISLAFVLRFWRLGEVPPSPDWDEASLGYNAYSILRTGKDEYGQSFPLIMRSFGDYKPALYVYLIIPFIKIFGLNTFAVRFPSAFLGALAVLLTYSLVKELFINENSNIPISQYLNILPEVTMLLLATSPWHIQFSRLAFESNLGLFFNILFLLLFLKGLKKPYFLPLSAASAALNLYTYQAEKLFTPLLVLSTLIIWRQEILKISRKYLLSSLFIGLIVLAPFVSLLFTTPQILTRAKGTSLTSDQTPFLKRTVEKLTRDQQNQDYLGLILDNRRITYLLAGISGYLSHFDLNWLFLTGDQPRHHAPNMGLLYLWELPFLFIGLYSLVFHAPARKNKFQIFTWFLLAPIPAAFTTGVPHAVRTLRFLPIVQIFVSLGIVKFWQTIKEKPITFKFLIAILTFSFLIFNFLYYLNQYFVQQNYFHSQSWQYGYQEAVEEVQKIANNYDRIIVSNQPHLDQSYIFFLFYLQYDPQIYQKESECATAALEICSHHFSKYQFRPIDWSQEEKAPAALYVGRPQDFPPEAKILKTINFLNGEPAISIVES